MRTTLDRFHVGIATEIGPLSLFPVWTETGATGTHRVTPDVGVAVAELAEPTVPQLAIVNELSVPVLLTEGTLLHGGRQTRVLNHDLLLRGGTRVEAEVSCVEQGRWSGGHAHALDGRVPLRVIASLRGTGAMQRDNARRHERQGRVWQDVARYGSRYGQSGTSNLRDLRDGQAEVRRDEQQARREQQRRAMQAALEQYARHLLPGQAGVLIGVLGQPLALEIITSPREFVRNIDALLKAYALDAVEVPGIPTPGRRARRFAERIMDSSLEQLAEDAMAMSFGASNEYVSIQTTVAHATHKSLHTLIVSNRHELLLAA